MSFYMLTLNYGQFPDKQVPNNTCILCINILRPKVALKNSPHLDEPGAAFCEGHNAACLCVDAEAPAKIKLLLGSMLQNLLSFLHWK